ncbi:MAG: DUF359 domain-containing protein, partial [Natronomonas sp.]
ADPQLRAWVDGVVGFEEANPGVIEGDIGHPAAAHAEAVAFEDQIAELAISHGEAGVVGELEPSALPEAAEAGPPVLVGPVERIHVPGVVERAGEEDLAALPAILASPDGAGIVYGQPDEGMVLATVDDDLRTFARELMERMDGDTERALTILNL